MTEEKNKTTRARKTTSLVEVPPQSANSVELNKKLKNAIATIERKLKKLGANREEEYLLTTSQAGSFKYNELDQNTVNIHTTMNLPYLLKAFSMLKLLEREYSQTMESLGIGHNHMTTLTWCNVPVEKWLFDMQISINRVANQTTIAELRQAQNELYGFLSNEDKLFNTLSKLKKLL